MSDLFDDPPPLPLPRRRPAPRLTDPAEIIARAVFPDSWHESPAVLREVSCGTPIDRHRHFQIERCRPAVEALRQKGLIP